ncbi:unnamed protein product (macronuclear) [Paramecium tetraurelia]|uniref:SET domain-containing protein n=1 Tax=Paramecium tetraurelia TaxID=5888 RepID=A0BWS5_PARTE|nr:uncharacterized protein GSPATT00032844001 [Paramecium tetraurelia]CAK62992.1 unnamed protein product [Paramecium tetraurelia]|eukprot:XP_001430390.1 hypothetical protein (macronuclear) [Paramecium tetraurelia strain d4-2]
MKRHSIGKKFRKIKALKKADPHAIIPEAPEQLQQYIKELTSKGLKINKVQYAMFQTKNGLRYPGLIATEPIKSKDTLVSLPKELLLTTRHAFESPLKQVFMEFPQLFSPKFLPQWEDYQFLAFLLYEYQKGPESKWHLLISNLPRDIDYAVFWRPEDQAFLEDKYLVKLAKKQRQDFMVAFKTLKFITDKYRNLFKPGIVTEENAIWLYTHIISRSFGGQGLKYVTMVPFCELFNHEQVDVCYDFSYKDRSSNYDDVFMSKKIVKGQEDVDVDDLSLSSSDHSQGSEDDISDSEFVMDDYDEYTEFDFDSFKEFSYRNFLENQRKMSDIKPLPNEEQEEFYKRVQNQQLLLNKLRKEFHIKLNIQRDVFQLAIDCKSFLFKNIDFGDNYSIFFLGQVFNVLDTTISDYFEDEKSSAKAREDIKKVQITCTVYKDYLYGFLNNVMKKPIQQKINMFAQKIGRKIIRGFETIEQVLSQPVDRKSEYYKSDWEIDNFENFHMRTRDPFEKGAQVYFCYSRLSNRQMLLKYGMALEYNKYDSTFLRVEYIKYLKNKEAIWMVHRFKLNKFKRFKLKYTVPPYDLIVFCKFVNWTLYVNSTDTLFKIKDFNLERKALSLALQILVEENASFKETIEELEKQLFDESVGYHEYFAIVYRLERLRIYRHNINLIKICIVVLDRIMNGVPFQEAIKKTEYDNDLYDTNRHILQMYFDQMKSLVQLSK